MAPTTVRLMIRFRISPAPTTRRWMMVENFSIASISAMLFTKMKTSTLTSPQDSTRQCHSANPSKMAFNNTKSPTMTIHRIIRFD